jgi:aminopeptidase-like protein
VSCQTRRDRDTTEGFRGNDIGREFLDMMKKLIEELTPLSRVFCSSDYDRAVDYLGKCLPFRELTFTADQVHNGWEIHPKWDVKSAKIRFRGETIYDGLEHPLRVIVLSSPFSGVVDRETLKEHLHFDRRYSEAVPYHFRQMYRPWDRDWGFCVPRSFFESLEPGDYEVLIETHEEPGVLKVLEHTHPGTSDACFVFVAHLDHPGMANDNVAGCAVGVELFRRLLDLPTRYTYKLLLVQELTGSVYYLANLPDPSRDSFVEGLCLDSLGSKTPLSLQESRHGDTGLEAALADSLEDQSIPCKHGPFRSICYNDEIIWESWGIPMASLSRVPFPENHCDRDNVDIIAEESLEEALSVLLATVRKVEESRLVNRRFDGTICLSHPDYDLYHDPGQASFGPSSHMAMNSDPEIGKKLRYMIDLLSTQSRPASTLWLAKAAGLSEGLVREQLVLWEEKGLLELR